MCSLAGRLLKTSVCLPLLLALNLSLTSCAKIRSVSNDLQFLTSSPTPSATATPTPEPTATPTPEPTATPTPEPTATPTPEPTATPTPEPTATPTPEPTATPTPEPTATPTPEPTATPTPEPTATPTPEPTATPTPNPKFGLPVTKIEVVVGDDAPPLQAFDLSGTNTGKAMSVTNIGSLPAGLTYNSTTGIITGTPTQAGDYNVEVCYVENSLTTSTCKTVLYSILEEKTISPSNQRTSSTADAGCTSSSGIGSLADPVLISTVSDLNTCVRTYPRAAFKLANDISLSGYPGTNSSDSFNPLPFFYGNFDGSGYKIQDWTWNISNSGLGIVHYNGLFKGIGMNAVVKNLTLKNISLTLPLVDSGTYSSANGILAGFIRGGFAFNITVENSTINCARSCAGLVGGTLNPKITNPSNADPSTDYKDGYLNRIRMNSITVNSNAGWSYAGGVAGGYNAPFRVSNTKVTGATIATGNSVGGILGSHLYGGAPSAATTSDSRVWIDRCSTAGSINDYPGNNAAFMGGLVGFMRGNDVITNSFSIMTLNSTDVSLGGLVGNIEASVNNVKESIIAHSYFAGSVNGSTGDRGLLIGDNYAAWSGTFTGENGIHLVHNKVQTQGSYGIIGGSAVSKINVINNSTETFTNLPNDWFDSSKFVGWLNSIWQFFTNAKPDLI